MLRRTRLGLLAAAGLAALLVSAIGAAPAAAISLFVAPAASMVGVGDRLDIRIAISGLGDGSAPSLGVYDVDLGFDPAVVSITSVSFGDPVLGDQLDLAGFGSVTDQLLGAGGLRLFELSLDSPALLDASQAAAFTLATVTFEGLAAGRSALALSVNALGDALGDPLAAEVAGGAVAVGPAVPEPDALSVFLIGALLVGFKVWRANMAGRTPSAGRLAQRPDPVARGTHSCASTRR